MAYVNETRYIYLNDVELDDVAVTTLGVGESITYVLSNNAGTVLGSGSGTHVSAGDWRASVTMPATGQTVHVHWTIVKGGATGYEHDVIYVETLD